MPKSCRSEHAAEMWSAEEAWVHATTCAELLAARTAISERKLRLFAVACARAVSFAFTDPWQRQTLTRVEDLADGTDPGRPYRGFPEQYHPRPVRWDVFPRLSWLSGGGPSAVASARAAVVHAALWQNGKATTEEVRDAATAAFRHRSPTDPGDGEREGDAALAGLLRDIAGDTFRVEPFDPAWRTRDAFRLARIMYDSRDFGLLPILADALQDAGCDDEDVLNHCRDTGGVHVRGCWVIDGVLGKV